ncbi:MAG: hypothetical protein ACI4I8_00125 [Oscillospiraceae bacterium]
MERQRQKDIQNKVKEVTGAFVDSVSFKTDPQGSYTGKPEEADEKPIQDVDDL